MGGWREASAVRCGGERARKRNHECEERRTHDSVFIFSKIYGVLLCSNVYDLSLKIVNVPKRGAKKNPVVKTNRFAESVRPKCRCSAIFVTNENQVDGSKPTRRKIHQIYFKIKPNEGFTSKDVAKKQIAVATYFKDKLALGAAVENGLQKIDMLLIKHAYDLTGLPMSNSSLLDEEIVVAESMTMCNNIERGATRQVFVALSALWERKDNRVAMSYAQKVRISRGGNGIYYFVVVMEFTIFYVNS
ncbi:hypothetical protein ACFE04_021514 [Oxalis oulophora]